MNRLHRSLFASFAFIVGCSSKALPPPPAVEDTGTTLFDGDLPKDSAITADGETVDSATDGTTVDGTTVDGTTTDGAVVDGTSSDVDMVDVAPVDSGPPAACAKSYSAITPTAVTYPGPKENTILAAITWDELTMAWTTVASGKVVVHYADRATRDAAFTSELTLPDTLGPFADDKVALYADGRTMLFVSADHKTIRQVTRTARGVAFDPTTATSTPFGLITGTGGEGGAAKQVADLTISKDGKWLFYTDLLVTSGPSIRLSIKLTDGTWDAPNVVTATRLEMDGTLRRRPTGLSSDNRTLFFLDEVLNATFLAFRPESSLSFNEFYGYSPSGTHAMPSDGCDRVYLDIDVPDSKPDGGLDGEVPVNKSIFRAP